jgi:hypothetical protein
MSIARHTSPYHKNAPSFIIKLKIEMTCKNSLQLVKAVVAAAAYEQRRWLHATSNDCCDFVNSTVAHLQFEQQISSCHYIKMQPGGAANHSYAVDQTAIMN